MKESDDWMIKIIYFDERELLVRKEIETKARKDTEAKITEVLPWSEGVCMMLFERSLYIIQLTLQHIYVNLYNMIQSNFLELNVLTNTIIQVNIDS